MIKMHSNFPGAVKGPRKSHDPHGGILQLNNNLNDSSIPK
jgi:hypothetical protein